MQIICPECDKPFDDDAQCWVCLARNEDMKETFSLAFPVALAGLTIGSLIAISLYPPLEANLLMIFIVPGISFVFAIGLAFILIDQLTRHARLIRFLIIFVAATWLMPAAYYFLNGILDGTPAKEVPSNVLSKRISQGEGGGPDVDLSLPWNQKRIEAVIRVNYETFSAIKPGDSVHLVVHSGAFAQPWYSDVLLSSSRDSNSR